jgi:hypothetical protein
MVDDDFGDHRQAPWTPGALGLTAVRIKPPMAVDAIHFERGGNAAVWICWTSLLFWTPAFNL